MLNAAWGARGVKEFRYEEKNSGLGDEFSKSLPPLGVGCLPTYDVLHTDINSFLIKNNLNTHYSNSLPIKTILIPTSAFIFSMSEYFLHLVTLNDEEKLKL